MDTSDLKQILALVEANNPIPEKWAPRKWLAPMIDHTLLNEEASEEQLEKLCDEAAKYGFATVCVYPKHIPFCARKLRETKVKPIAVVGFPTGRETTKEKVAQTLDAIDKGAKEIDMVLAVHKLKHRSLRNTYLDIRKVVQAAKEIPVKVILETCLLDNEEKAMACALSKAAGAAFVKTSTGFSTGGATTDDIALMRRAVGEDMGVKASGGVRTLKDAVKMVLAGANRIGASAGVSIVGGSGPDEGNPLY